MKMVSRTRERERERELTHSYWYKSSALRVDYSLPIVVAAGMMKMATGDDSLLRQGAETGSRFVFGGYRALRRRNFCSRLTPRVFGIFGIL